MVEEEEKNLPNMQSNFLHQHLYSLGIYRFHPFLHAILYPRPYILILIFIAGGLSFYSIFQYRNRINQIKIGAINSIIMSITISIILYELFYNEVMIKNTFDINILISFYLIFTALIFNSIANRFIKKDELLVNESDRIR